MDSILERSTENIKAGICNNKMMTTSRLFNVLKKVLLNNGEIIKKYEAQNIQTIFLPTLIYGSKLWVLNRGLQSKLTAPEIKMLRIINGLETGSSEKYKYNN